MREGNDGQTTWAEDESMESAVLRQLLDLHPMRLTLAELVRELDSDGGSFAGRDAVERAVRDLTGVGLLHKETEFVTPTRAALRFNELAER